MRIQALIYLSFGTLLLALVFSFSASHKNKPAPARLIINISHFAGEKILKLDSVSYKNALGQDFTISKFKYYIGQICLKEESGRAFRSEVYFLVNEEEAGSKRLVLENVPKGSYTSLEFIIGVDSLHNCSGAQSGALDPVNGMFWAWNSGYIFLKLEGVSPSSKSPGHFFEYHIGGYKQPNNCIRKVSLTPGKSEVLKVPEISLKVDVLELLQTPTPLDFSTLSSVTGSDNASLVADNYKDMFSILNKKHEN